MTAEPSYLEVQRFPRLWVGGLLGAAGVFVALVAPFSILSWAILVVVGAFVFSITLRTEVRADGVYVKFWPIHRSFRHVPWTDIERLEAIEYNSLTRAGGWGLRMTANEVTYNVGGSEGVAIERDGKRDVLVGSSRAEELTAAIEAELETSQAATGT
jgi:hypothetical protein